ncbi:PPOX class F420-dependent oxidoreductase [Streptomyces sp. TR06-5]|uniref:PPOX class F420-dependent oxidoreductase n=1 Tax=unclassified Streptomyces TaxID=2593676 RepID=UPI00399F3797
MSFLSLGDHEYVSLVTRRRTGAPVPTPVWIVRDGDELLVWTRSDSGKVKRLRNDPRVTLAPCDVRGRVADAAPAAAGTARLLEDSAGLTRVRRAMARKYGWKFRLMDSGGAVLRLGRRPHTGIAVRPEPSADGPQP